MKEIKETMQEQDTEETEPDTETEESSITTADLKNGIRYFAKQGKVFWLFVLMVAYFLFVDVLYIFHIIKGIWIVILTAPIAVGLLIAYGVYINKHSNDDM